MDEETRAALDTVIAALDQVRAEQDGPAVVSPPCLMSCSRWNRSNVLGGVFGVEDPLSDADSSKRWLTGASVGSPKTASRNFSIDVCS
jgi:hypothetical protein